MNRRAQETHLNFSLEFVRIIFISNYGFWAIILRDRTIIGDCELGSLRLDDGNIEPRLNLTAVILN